MSTMPKRLAALVAHATLFACILTLVPLGAIAGVSGAARLEGLLLGVDGRPAGGYTMHLIDADGGAAGQATTDADGLYSFGQLRTGEYSLGVESPQGNVAPVAAPPVRVASGELVRRDVKLMQADASTVDQSIGANYAVGIWWAGLSTPAKIWTVLGAVVVVGVTVAALDDDDDDEPPASPLTP